MLATVKQRYSMNKIGLLGELDDHYDYSIVINANDNNNIK